MLAAITLISIGLVSLYFLNVLRNRKYNALAQKFGCRKGLPILGVLLHLKLRDSLYEWPRLVRTSKSVFTWFGSLPIFYTHNPDYIEKIFLSPDCDLKSELYHLIDIEIGPGLVTIEGSKHAHHRKSLNPSFNNRILTNFFPTFNEKSSLFVKQLDSVVGKGEVEMYHRIASFTITTAFDTLMGVQFQDGDEKAKKLMVHLGRYWSLLMDRNLSAFQKYDFIYRLSKASQSYTESKEYVNKFIRDMVNDRIKSSSSEKNQTSSIDEDIKKSDKIFLDHNVHLLQRDMFSWDEVFYETITLVFAGFETSASTLYTILLLLAMHPEYQEKLFEEIINFYPGKEFDVKCEDLKHLVYLDMVINETMRATAIVPMIGRVVTKDTKISEDIVLPAGTNLVIDMFNMHRLEDIWGPDAKEFNPDHFLPENLEKVPSNCFAPFAKGARNCIGMRYAGYFLRSSLAKIIRNYRFTTKHRYEDLRFVLSVTLRYETTPLMEVHRR